MPSPHLRRRTEPQYFSGRSLDPEAYLRDVIARIADHSVNRIRELLPWTGAAHASPAAPSEAA